MIPGEWARKRWTADWSAVEVKMGSSGAEVRVEERIKSTRKRNAGAKGRQMREWADLLGLMQR